VKRRLTPASGARVYSLRAASGLADGLMSAGSGGSNYASLPAFIRITKV
jgi:hypothetical protein